MTPGDAPHYHATTSTLTIKLELEVSAKLATLRRELRPEMDEAEFVAWLLRDHLVGLGMLPLGERDRGPGARRG